MEDGSGIHEFCERQEHMSGELGKRRLLPTDGMEKVSNFRWKGKSSTIWFASRLWADYRIRPENKSEVQVTAILVTWRRKCIPGEKEEGDPHSLQHLNSFSSHPPSDM